MSKGRINRDFSSNFHALQNNNNIQKYETIWLSSEMNEDYNVFINFLSQILKKLQISEVRPPMFEDGINFSFKAQHIITKRLAIQ